MRWTVVIFWIAAAINFFIDEDVDAIFFMLGAIAFILMEIADNTKHGGKPGPQGPPGPPGPIGMAGRDLR